MRTQETPNATREAAEPPVDKCRFPVLHEEALRLNRPLVCGCPRETEPQRIKVRP